MSEVPSATPLWNPSDSEIAKSNLTSYLQWLEKTRGLKFASYAELWTWSTTEIEAFWLSMSEHFQVLPDRKQERVLSSHAMPGAKWFPESETNYAQRLLDMGGDADTAIIFEGETEGGLHRAQLTRGELRRQVKLVATQLRAMGVRPGDCVAGFLSNTPETVVAFLASACIGAIWSNCPVEMTSRSVLDRLEQIAPKVLFVSRSYWYGGKRHDRAQVVDEIVAGLPSAKHVIAVGDDAGKFRPWADLLAAKEIGDFACEKVPFEHPLWVLYSSGTTGKPKAIVHGHGGILLEHLKVLALHLDLQPGDKFFWYTTSGWMMWNLLVSGLLLPGVTICLYDGSPKFPDFHALWNFVAREGITYFGSSAPYYMACRKEGLTPGRQFNLGKLRGVGSTAAPLPVEGFRWIYDEVKRDVHLGSISGGTDVCSAFVLAHPHLPVVAGQLQCLGLGAKIEAWNEMKQSVFGAVGELVLTAPFPAMPVRLWNDPDDSRLRASYYEKFPGVWSHGDWIEIDATGGPAVIHGRSDATLNRGGLRMGTVEFYAIVEALPGIAESLVIDTGGLGREDALLLFIALRPGHSFDDAMRAQIVQTLKRDVSPRHVPDGIYEVPEIPHTLNGKKLEVPVKRILAGVPVEQAVSAGALANPAALDFFVRLAPTLGVKKS